jgi:hypothetical protein
MWCILHLGAHICFLAWTFHVDASYKATALEASNDVNSCFLCLRELSLDLERRWSRVFRHRIHAHVFDLITTICKICASPVYERHECFQCHNE